MPEGQFTAIAAGNGLSCGIRADRTIACWGYNKEGRTDTPTGQYTAIASGDRHSCAIRTSQTIACWGSNQHGRTDAPAGQYTAIASGDRHSCAIRSDQTIACWGSNQHGRTDAPEGQFTAIAAGIGFSCGIRADRTIACWGYNWAGQTDAPAGQFTAIAAGNGFSCGIRADRTTACWGYNKDGQTDTPTGQFTAIAAGHRHSCAIRTDETIACWGNDWNYIVDTPVDSYRHDFRVRASGNYRWGPLSCEFRTNQALFCWNGDFHDHPAAPERRIIEGAFSTSTTQFFDTWDREAVRASALAEFNRREPYSGWTGNTGSCVAGTTSQEYRDSIFQRINWYRQMAGVLPTVEDPERSRKAQGKALIMAAEGRLSHSPTDDWACYTRQAYDTSESLASTSGIRAINAYMEDSGENNKAVGHRGMVIDSVARRLGTGDIPGAANALQGGTGYEYQVPRGYLAWPPPGYVPYRVVWRRWSFHQTGNYSRATVTVVNDNGPVESEIVYAGRYIVWEMDPPGVPDGDLCYTVTISGVQLSDGIQTNYKYVTCVIDPRE